MKDTSIPARAAWWAIIAAALYQLLLVALIFIRPDIAPYSHTISEWAIGTHGWIMSMAFLISATSYAALLIAVKSEVRGVLGYTGLAILAICALGTAGAGLFTTDPFDAKTLSTRGTLHLVSAFSSVMLLPFAALLINLTLALGNAQWLPARRTLLLTACLPLLGMIGFWVHLAIYVIPLGENARGPDVPLGYPNRVLLLIYMIWLITLAWTSIQRRSE